MERDTMNKRKTICNICGKEFNEWDEILGDNKFDVFVNYPSKYDINRIKINLCVDCYDSVLDKILPMCKINPIVDDNWIDHCTDGKGIIHRDWGSGGSKHLTRLIVNGSRTFDDYALLEKKLDAIISDLEDVEIVSGHARGADSLGERYAKEHGIPCKVMPAEWKKYGKAAGIIRNQQMIDYAKEEIPLLVTFWDGKSHGTKHTIEKAMKDGIQVVIGYMGKADEV